MPHDDDEPLTRVLQIYLHYVGESV